MQLLVSSFFRSVVECEQPFVATRNPSPQPVSDIRAIFPRVHDTNGERLQAATPGVRAFDMQQKHPEYKNFIHTEKAEKEREKETTKKMCKDLRQPHRNEK
jgi:hypothetical protein